MLGSKKTVANILKQFTKMIDELDKIVEDTTAETLAIDEIVVDLKKEQHTLNTEMERAMSVRSNLNNLIGE